MDMELMSGCKFSFYNGSSCPFNVFDPMVTNFECLLAKYDELHCMRVLYLIMKKRESIIVVICTPKEI